MWRNGNCNWCNENRTLRGKLVFKTVFRRRKNERNACKKESNSRCNGVKMPPNNQYCEIGVKSFPRKKNILKQIQPPLYGSDIEQNGWSVDKGKLKK